MSNLDRLVSELNAGVSDSNLDYIQIPFRITEHNFVRVDEVKKGLTNKTRNQLLNELLEIGLDQLVLKLSKRGLEVEF